MNNKNETKVYAIKLLFRDYVSGWNPWNSSLGLPLRVILDNHCNKHNDLLRDLGQTAPISSRLGHLLCFGHQSGNRHQDLLHEFCPNPYLMVPDSQNHMGCDYFDCGLCADRLAKDAFPNIPHQCSDHPGGRWVPQCNYCIIFPGLKVQK